MDRPYDSLAGHPTAAAAALANLAQSGDHLLFVYGTLRRGRHNHHLLADAPFVGKARTKERFAMYTCGVPCVVRGKPVCPIVGEVYRVTEEQLTRIDLHEGHPAWYRRERVDVELRPGVLLPAWLYFFPTPEGHLVPGGDYDACP